MTDTTAPAGGGALPSQDYIAHPDGQIVERRTDAEGRDGWFLTGEFV